MKKYWTLMLFFLLILIWSFFFWAFKFFFWASLWDIFENKYSLAYIAGFMSFGSIFAFLIWWSLSYSFKEKHILIVCSLISVILMLIYYFIRVDELIIWIIIVLVWFFYWTRSVVKNVLISIEIKKTWLQDTTVNAIATIIFLFALIVWTILWPKLFEIFWNEWIFVIILTTILIWILSIFLEYEDKSKDIWEEWIGRYILDRHEKFIKSLKAFIPNIKVIFSSFMIIILASSILWAVSTVLSQQAMEYVNEFLWKSKSESGIIMLYSVLWAIAWNFLTLRASKIRWKLFNILNLAYGLLVLFIPFFLNSYITIVLIAIASWVAFWAVSNLIDGFMFNRFWKEQIKEYWSAVYGFFLSITATLVMFICWNIWDFSFSWVFYFLWICILFVSAIVYFFEKKINTND